MRHAVFKSPLMYISSMPCRPSSSFWRKVRTRTFSAAISSWQCETIHPCRQFDVSAMCRSANRAHGRACIWRVIAPAACAAHINAPRLSVRILCGAHGQQVHIGGGDIHFRFARRLGGVYMKNNPSFSAILPISAMG